MADVEAGGTKRARGESESEDDDDLEISDMSIRQLKDFLEQRGVAHADAVERSDLEARVREAYRRKPILRKKKLVKMGRECPYLDTVHRPALDFDVEKLCSITLINQNVYVCLVCGKYFNGRARGTPAHTHSVECGHYVFMNLKTSKIFCLPDDYEVIDPSLDDIKYNLAPNFTGEQIAALDKRTRTSLALDGSEYLPGFVGLNNLKKTDGISCVVQALMRVVPLRNYLMDPGNYSHCNSLVLEKLGELARKIWNPSNYKSQVSPHELVQACSLVSNKKFRPGARSDVADFLAWILNSIDRELTKANKIAAQKASRIQGKKIRKPRNIIQDCFQGKVRVMTEKISEKTSAVSAAAANAGLEEKDIKSTFLILDLPPTPLYKDSQDKLVIPQVSIFTLLEKFDGETSQELRGGVLRRLRLMAPLPRYMIFIFKRFKANQFFIEKNPTLVTFPVKNLELKDYCDGESPPGIGTKFNLVANICHDGPADAGTYTANVINRASDEWYTTQDLHVEEVLAQQVALTETYLQIYERIDVSPDSTVDDALDSLGGFGP